MRLSLKWLSEFIDIQHSAEELSHILTNAGIEVEAIETIGSAFNGVVVGEVLEVKKHPDADKLCVATVSDGQEQVQVVCGASNCRQGLKTAFAKVGAEVQGQKIRHAKLRGVESFGMLCAAGELGLAEETPGIMELDVSLKAGTDLSSIYRDTLLDVALTPNLGHCLSVLGIARELSAATGKPLRMPVIQVKESGGADKVRVTVQDVARCPRYACRVIRDVKIGPSPDWIQQRLIAVGLRPINNIVDVTNYVLMELGHPLHAFDLDKIAGQEIVVRTAKEGESFVTLDGKERRLSKEDLLICDKEKPVAIGGVMGGANSEVTDTTKNVLIESAYFDPVTIRKTSKRLGLQSESTKRFERGADPDVVLNALNRAAMLIEAYAGGKVSKEIVDVKEKEFLPWTISLRLNKVNSLLGTSLSMSEVESTLKKLGLQPVWNGKDAFAVSVPTYRFDLQIEVDLIEEVARLYGYNNISKESAAYQTSAIPHSPLYLFEKEIRERLRGEGLQEFLSCDLISPHSLALLQQEEKSIARVLNPTSEEQSVLRTSLLPGFLELVKYNIAHQSPNISGFEIGRVYYKKPEGYGEQAVAGIVLTGKSRPPEWDHQAEDVDFYDLKGILENLLDQLDITDYTFKKSAFPSLHSGRQASVYVGKLEVASFGEVHPSILRQLDISQRVLFAEINMQDLMQVRPVIEKMEPLPKYPGSQRDWTITLDETVPIGQVLSVVKSTPSKLLQAVSLMYLYRSERIGHNKKNATFNFIYRDSEKTVSQEDVEAEHARIVDETTKTLKL